MYSVCPTQLYFVLSANTATTLPGRTDTQVQPFNRQLVVMDRWDGDRRTEALSHSS